MAWLTKRGSVYYIKYSISGKKFRSSTNTENLQIAKEKLRQFESAQARGDASPLPTKTSIADALTAYVAHIRATKTAKSAQTDVYYLRDAFGPVCDAVRVTSRKVSESKKRPPKPGQDRRRKAAVIEAGCFEQITTAQIASFISGHVASRGLAPKTANRYREILTRMFSWSMTQNGVRMPSDKNPAAKVERYREHAPEIRFLTLTQVTEQLSTFDEDVQMQAMVATLNRVFSGDRMSDSFPTLVDRQTVFLSHANPADNQFTLWLALRLAREGYEVWCDLTKLLGGDDFWIDIEQAIRQRARKVVYILSRASNQAGGVLKEIAVAAAVGKKLKDTGFVIPVKIDDLPFADHNIEINRLNALSFTKGWAEGLAGLLKTLQEDGVPKVVGDEEPLNVVVTNREEGIDLPDNLHVITSRRKLEAIDETLAVKDKFLARMDVLLDPIEQLRGHYDYILLDTAPNATAPTIASYKVADWFILSAMPDPFAIDGLRDAMLDIQAVQKRGNPKLRILGVILSAVDERTRLARTLAEYVKNAFKSRHDETESVRFKTIIHRSTVIPEPQKVGRTLFETEPAHKVTDQYRQLAAEFDARIGLGVPAIDYDPAPETKEAVNG